MLVEFGRKQRKRSPGGRKPEEEEAEEEGEGRGKEEEEREEAARRRKPENDFYWEMQSVHNLTSRGKTLETYDAVDLFS